MYNCITSPTLSYLEPQGFPSPHGRTHEMHRARKSSLRKSRRQLLRQRSVLVRPPIDEIQRQNIESFWFRAAGFMKFMYCVGALESPRGMERPGGRGGGPYLHGAYEGRYRTSKKSCNKGGEDVRDKAYPRLREDPKSRSIKGVPTKYPFSS